jgi:Tol biopolymer transport system component
MTWSPDGRQLVYTRQQGTNHDLWVHDMDGAQEDRPLLAGPASELSPVLSPDGRWLAYMGDESGRTEVYIQAYPEGERHTVSRESGGFPLWSADGSALHFIGLHADTRKMLQVAVTVAATGLQLGTPEPLFDMQQASPDGTGFSFVGGDNGIGAGYDILPDGRFVLVRSPLPDNREIVLVQNWFDEVRRLAPLPAPAE